jgi:alkanesulfonate monooxygenase SsuD/methylene tetrahydromethanopterin reductase-like flavin-dependent oxidoreductase (luciferase family)
MEIATLARLYPGRFLPGFGHGVADWMRQIGAFPSSQLAAIEEVTRVTRALLRGESVTFHGQHVHLDQVQLEFPPQQVPPIVLGVRGPKSMEVVGRSADGVLLAEFSAPAYVARARDLMQTSHRQAGRTDRLRMNVYAFCAVDDDPSAARLRLRALTARALPYIQAHLEPLGILPEVEAMLANSGIERLEREMPDAWLDQLHIVGTPSDCAAAIRALAAAGADSVILVPVDDPSAAGVEPLARKLLPLLH